jgi:hypothetical protein
MRPIVATADPGSPWTALAVTRCTRKPASWSSGLAPIALERLRRGMARVPVDLHHETLLPPQEVDLPRFEPCVDLGLGKARGT